MRMQSSMGKGLKARTNAHFGVKKRGGRCVLNTQNLILKID